MNIINYHFIKKSKTFVSTVFYVSLAPSQLFTISSTPWFFSQYICYNFFENPFIVFLGISGENSLQALFFYEFANSLTEKRFLSSILLDKGFHGSGLRVKSAACSWHIGPDFVWIEWYLQVYSALRHKCKSPIWDDSKKFTKWACCNMQSM